MPKINKTASGLLLYEDFKQNSLMWTPSPNNFENISFGEGGLKIQHSTTYKTITLNQPDTNFTFVCKINHRPIDANDIGGVIIMSNDTFYVECQSYVATGPSHLENNSNHTERQITEFIDKFLDKYVEYSIENDEGVFPEGSDEEDTNTEGGTGNGNQSSDGSNTFIDEMYPYFKITKLNYKYTFFASIDGFNWIEVGNTEMSDSNRIGFFLYSYDESIDVSNSHFYVEYAVIYNNNYVIIDNIKDNQTIELRDENGDLICDSTSRFVAHKNNQILIDTTLLNIPLNNARLTVLQNNKFIYDHEIAQLVGGDVYAYNYDIKLCIDNQEINQEELFDLGVFYHNEQTIRLDIYNQEEFTLENLRVSITSYSFYYGGNETIEISLYDESETKYDFSDSVVIPEILPTEGKSILIRLNNRVLQDFYKKEGQFRFKINIE